MEEAAAVRRAALRAVDDVEPARLRERIEGRLDDGSMAPGVLTVLSARAAHENTAEEPLETAFPHESVVERGAGVQLIYEGLRLTRTLAHEEPWLHDRPEDGDMAILVADILVARGFYLLARTEAASAAVGVVRSFGRDQTERRVAGDESPDRNLEADVFELAVVAGTTATGGHPHEKLRKFVAELARTDGSLPVAAGIFSDGTRETLDSLVESDRAGSGGVATSADH